jgi:hypothetical protein
LDRQKARFDQFGCMFVVGGVPQTRGTPSSRHNFLTLMEFMGVSVGVLALICALVLLVRDARSTETGLHLRLGLVGAVHAGAVVWIWPMWQQRTLRLKFLGRT